MAYEDLLKDSSFPLDNKNYFNLTITDLNISTLYPLEFRWKYEDGSFGPWSAVKSITTPGESFPNVPSTLTIPNNTPGHLQITWDGNTSTGSALINFDRVDVYINGAPFDSAKPALSFFSAGTKTVVAPAGTYIVSSYAVSKIGTLSAMSTAVTRTVTAVGTPVQTPTLPSGITVATAPFAVTVNWPGTYSASTFTGFKSIDIYAAASDLGSSTTSGISSTNLVGSLTVNNTPNKINISLDNLKQALSLSSTSDVYTSTIFYYFNATNIDGTQYGSPTYTRINSTSVVPTKANFIDLASGVISIENLVAGNGQFAAWLRTGTAGGSRIELSSVSDFTNGGHTVQKGLVAYSSGSNELFNLDLDAGSLTINGSGTFTGDLTAGSGSSIFKSDSSGIYLGNSSFASAPFSVSRNGVLKANSGTIGGWTLGSTFLQGSNFEINSSSSTIFVGPTSGQHIRISSSGGIATYNGGTQTSAFNLSTSGSLSLSGSVSASSGSIGGWTIGPTTLTGGGTTLNSNGTISVAGGNGTVSLNNNGTITISAANSGIGALSVSGDGKTSTLYANQLQLNNAYIYEAAGGISGPPAGAMTLNTTNSTKEIHLFSPQDISGTIHLNRTVAYGGITPGTGATVVLVSSSSRIAYVSSSRKFKKNIVALNPGTYLSKILELEPVSFDWKDQPEDVPYRINYGLIAEDVSQIPIMESLVNYDENNEPVNISYDRLTPFLVMAIKELATRLDALEG